MNEALARVVKRIAGARVEISNQDVWLYLAAQYPGQAEKYNSVLYLLEFKGTDSVLLLEAARLHVQDITPVKAGDETLVGSWFPTVAQLKKAIRAAEGKRWSLERLCTQTMQYEDAPLTISELAERVGVKEVELDFFLPEYRYQMSGRAESVKAETFSDWEDEESDEDVVELPLEPYAAVWQAASQEMGTWKPESRQWFEKLMLIRVYEGIYGAILELATSSDLIVEYVDGQRESLLGTLNQHGRETDLRIEDLVVVVYEEVQA